MELFVAAGAVLGFLAVALGAFGAHTLKERLADAGQQPAFDTAVRYQLAHAVVLLVLPQVLAAEGGTSNLAGWLLLCGTVVFSGALYIRAIADRRQWGMVAPVGGLALLAGWALLLVAAVTAR